MDRIREKFRKEQGRYQAHNYFRRSCPAYQPADQLLLLLEEAKKWISASCWDDGSDEYFQKVFRSAVQYAVLAGMTLTAGSLFEGALEIYDTTNRFRFVLIYRILGVFFPFAPYLLRRWEQKKLIG